MKTQIEKMITIEEKLQWIPVKEKLPPSESEYQIIGRIKPAKICGCKFKIINIYVWESDAQIKNKMGGYSHWSHIPFNSETE
jgi:hypothetical protein